ncbi:hypothetical protein HW115_09105 [Verrucomicrobiaceae bacterium N1E253]|uniref:Uncharacterized protein n=1 Tax=Oceaniferula marina TaxID=2748318 RepID=A0A851GL04_9BACT|nr:hypothetical protein [Oceaniferula marina]NWK55767.1 hypothetical protein [Oceaniferula marina]
MLRFFSLTLLPLFVLFCSPASAEDPVVFHWKGSKAGHSIELKIVGASYRKDRHEVVGLNDPDTRKMKIDGRSPWGVEGVLPEKELISFELKWDGVVVPVPEALWKDCFNLHLHPYKEPAMMEPGELPFIKITEDGKQIIFGFDGADASFAYAVTWVLTQKGEHARWIEPMT